VQTPLSQTGEAAPLGAFKIPSYNELFLETLKSNFLEAQKLVTEVSVLWQEGRQSEPGIVRQGRITG
jgi:hypothetical protein